MLTDGLWSKTGAWQRAFGRSMLETWRQGNDILTLSSWSTSHSHLLEKIHDCMCYLLTMQKRKIISSKKLLYRVGIWLMWLSTVDIGKDCSLQILTGLSFIFRLAKRSSRCHAAYWSCLPVTSWTMMQSGNHYLLIFFFYLKSKKNYHQVVKLGWCCQGTYHSIKGFCHQSQKLLL